MELYLTRLCISRVVGRDNGGVFPILTFITLPQWYHFEPNQPRIPVGTQPPQLCGLAGSPAVMTLTGTCHTPFPISSENWNQVWCLDCFLRRPPRAFELIRYWQSAWIRTDTSQPPFTLSPKHRISKSVLSYSSSYKLLCLLLRPHSQE